MKKKTMIALALCLAAVFCFTACGEETLAEENRTEIKEEQAAGEDNKSYGELSEEVQDSDYGYEKDRTAVAGVGETMSNDFFDWTVNSYEVKKKTQGVSAGKGYKFVIINMTMKNTEEEGYETGNYEFRGVISGQAEDLDSENAFYPGMLADEFYIDAGQTVTGDVLFKVPEDCSALIVNYLEMYGDESAGNMYWYELDLTK